MSVNTNCPLETYFANFFLYQDFYDDFPLLETKGIYKKDDYEYRNIWNILRNEIDKFQIYSFHNKWVEDRNTDKSYAVFHFKNITDNIKNLYVYYRQSTKVETNAAALTVQNIREPYEPFIFNNHIIESVSIIIEVNMKDIPKKLEGVFFHEMSHIIYYTLSGTYADIIDKNNILGQQLLNAYGPLSKDNLMYLNGDLDLLSIEPELLIIKYCTECLYYLNKSELSAKLENIYNELKNKDSLYKENIVKNLRIISDDFNKYCCLYNGANKIEKLIKNNSILKNRINNNRIINVYFKDNRNKKYVYIINYV